MGCQLADPAAAPWAARFADLRSDAMLDRKEASEPTDFAEPGGL